MKELLPFIIGISVFIGVVLGAAAALLPKDRTSAISAFLGGFLFGAAFIWAMAGLFALLP